MGQLAAGAARRPITPPGRVRLAGYPGHRNYLFAFLFPRWSQGVHDTLRRLGVLKRPLQGNLFNSETWLIDLPGARMVTLPGQPFAILGQELRDGLAGGPLFLLGVTNDEVSYIVPPDQFDWRNRQERISLGPDTWPTLRDAILGAERGE